MFQVQVPARHAVRHELTDLLGRPTLNDALQIVLAQQRPHLRRLVVLSIARLLPDLVDDGFNPLRLQLSNRDSHSDAFVLLVPWPQCSACTENLAQHTKRHGNVAVSVCLQEGRAIVDEKRRSTLHVGARGEALVHTPSPRQLNRQALFVLPREAVEDVYDLRIRLRHDGDSHEGDGFLIFRHRKLRRNHVPTSLQVRLNDLRLGLFGEVPEVWD
mmetsp:Transcript_128727/g.372490  ORF Transcript_128727/g.372490 Transcript_128727/m.372490 type:complete len:215 (-) Transcript_128727:2148-2792(-)